jgi:hypothetical protein
VKGWLGEYGRRVTLDHELELVAGSAGGIRGSGGSLRIRSVGAGSAGAALALRIRFDSRLECRPDPGCGILQSPLWNGGISARLRSAVGYIGPCGDILGQLALTLEDCTGVTSVAGG